MGELEGVSVLLKEWERWSAEVLESHISYPSLLYYRSQHDNESWLAALAAILDTCALVISGVVKGPSWQARLTLAMASHTVVDLPQEVRVPPHTPRLPRRPHDKPQPLRPS